MIMGIVGGTNDAAAGGDTPYITTSGNGTSRNDFTGCVGFTFTVGAANITVTSFGRWITSGNSQTHTIRLFKVSDDSEVTNGTVNASGAPVGYLYTSITPVVLTAGVAYHILSEEVISQDQWYGDDGTTTGTADATLNGSRYIVGACPTSAGSGSGSGGNHAYVQVNFKYHL